MYYTIYKTTNLINGRFYIGKHKTDKLDDSYLGSGKLLKQAIRRYGIQNFKKEILHVFETEHEMNKKEKELVVLSEESYNLCEGGNGGFDYINKTNIPKFHGKSHTQETRDKISKKAMGNKHTLGKKHSDETKRKIGEKSRARLIGHTKTEETKRKISETLKKRHMAGVA